MTSELDIVLSRFRLHQEREKQYVNDFQIMEMRLNNNTPLPGDSWEQVSLLRKCYHKYKKSAQGLYESLSLYNENVTAAEYTAWDGDPLYFGGGVKYNRSFYY